MLDADMVTGIDVEACRPAQKHTLARQQAFLAAYAVTGTDVAAAKAAGINNNTPRRWREGDVFGFRDRFDCVLSAFGDSLEDTMLSRINEPEGNRGSDILLIFALKAAKPEKYRDAFTLPADSAKDVLKLLGRPRTKVDSYTDETAPTPIEAMRAKNEGGR
jgi:hypothetical protein